MNSCSPLRSTRLISTQALTRRRSPMLFTIINISKMVAIENTQNVFDLTTDALLPSGARIELTFLLAGLLVEQRKVPLQESINALDYEYVGYDRGTGTITVYTVVEHILPLRE